MDTLESTPGFVEQIGAIKNYELEQPTRKIQRNKHSSASPDDETTPVSKKRKLKQVFIVCCKINNSKIWVYFVCSVQ